MRKQVSDLANGVNINILEGVRDVPAQLGMHLVSFVSKRQATLHIIMLFFRGGSGEARGLFMRRFSALQTRSVAKKGCPTVNIYPPRKQHEVSADFRKPSDCGTLLW